MSQITNSLYFGEIAALIAALCWSIAVIIFRSASKEISPFLITALKNTIAFISFIIFFLFLDVPLWYYDFDMADYITILISGVLGMGFADILFIFALSKIGANRIAIINCFEPTVIYLFSILILGTFLNVQQLLGFFIVIFSILIISYEKDFDDIDSLVKKKGILLQITAVFLSSFGIVIIKPILSTINFSIEMQLWVTAFRLFPGLIVAWIVFLFQKNKFILLMPLKKPKLLWKIIISSGLGTFVALSFWIIGYANIEKPPIASIIGQTSTIFILLLSWIVLKEKITKIRLISILIAVCGVVLTILY